MQDEEDMILSAQRKDKERPTFFRFIWSSVIESPVFKPGRTIQRVSQ